jgi:hypothetical protein
MNKRTNAREEWCSWYPIGIPTHPSNKNSSILTMSVSAKFLLESYSFFVFFYKKKISPSLKQVVTTLVVLFTKV